VSKGARLKNLPREKEKTKEGGFSKGKVNSFHHPTEQYNEKCAGEYLPPDSYDM